LSVSFEDIPPDADSKSRGSPTLPHARGSRIANTSRRLWPHLSEGVRVARAVTSMLTLSQDVRLTKSQDGGILLDLRGGAFFHLNPAATRILELLKAGADYTTIVRVIGTEFEASESVVKTDIDDFLATLRTARLLQDEEPRTPA
jgi:hypothetical protein